MSNKDLLFRLIVGMKDDTQGGQRSVKQGINSISSQLQNLERAAIGFFSIWQTASAGKAVFQTGLEFQALETKLKAVFGTSQRAAKELAFIRQTADQLGVPLQESAAAFSNLSAAMNIAGFAVSESEQAFTHFATAISGLQLNQAQTERFFLAITQIASKPNVQLEEFTQQLSDLVPGAIGIADKALGGLSGRFQELVNKGQLASRDFLLPFARAMAAQFPAATDTSQAALNRFNNQWLELKLTLSQGGFLEGSTNALKDLTRTLKDPGFQSGLRNFSELLGGTVNLIVRNADTLLQVAAGFAGMRAGAAAGRLAGPQGALIGGAAGAAAGFFGSGEAFDGRRLQGFKLADTAAELGLQYRDLLQRMAELRQANEANPLQPFGNALALTEKQLDQVKSRLLELGQAAGESARQAATALQGFGFSSSKRQGYRGSATPFDELFQAYESFNNLPSGLLRAIAKQESDFNPQAISTQGAQGLMQFMPATARQYGVSNPFDPREAIAGAGKYMAYLMKLFNGEIEKAVAAYNAGEGSVQKAGGNLARLKPETQAYVPKVLGYLEDYGNLKMDIEPLLKAQQEQLKAQAEQRQAFMEMDSQSIQDSLKRREIELKASLDRQQIDEQSYYLSLAQIRNQAIDAEIAALQRRMSLVNEQAQGQGEAAQIQAKTEVARLTLEITRLEATRGDVQTEAVTRSIQKELELADKRREANESLRQEMEGILAQTEQGKARAQLEMEEKFFNFAQSNGLKVEQFNQGLTVIKDRFGQTTDQMSEFAIQGARNMQSYFANYLFDPFNKGLDGMLMGFLDVIRRMAAEAAAASLFDALLGQQGKGGGRSGGWLSGLLGALGGAAGSASSGTAGGGGGGWLNLLYGIGNLAGSFFASGGYTGTGGKYQPAGIVHAGEYVFSQDSVKRLGLNFLDNLHRGPSIPRPSLSYAEGGMVAPAALGGTAIRIVNSIDPELAGEFLESSRGEKVLHNYISRNAQTIRQMLS